MHFGELQKTYGKWPLKNPLPPLHMENSMFFADTFWKLPLGKVTNTKAVRIQKNQRLYKLEKQIHGNNLSEMKNCLKNNLEHSNAKTLVEDGEPGILRRYTPNFENYTDYLEENSLAYYLLNKITQIINVYVDLFKVLIFCSYVYQRLRYWQLFNRSFTILH